MSTSGHPITVMRVCSYACVFACLCPTDGSGSSHVVESPVLLSEQSLLLELQAGVISGWLGICLSHFFTRLTVCQKSTQTSTRMTKIQDTTTFNQILPPCSIWVCVKLVKNDMLGVFGAAGEIYFLITPALSKQQHYFLSGTDASRVLRCCHF